MMRRSTTERPRRRTSTASAARSSGKGKPPSVTPRTITKIGQWNSIYKSSLHARGRKGAYEIDNTLNYRFSTRSYKDKRKIEHPREECLVFENTHPAIISKEVWDIVQRVRKNKRRRTKMDEQNKYSGLVICADCGKTMVLHRAHTMSADYNHFTCRTYKKDGEACTAHYIRECILDEIVLEDLRWVTAEAREHPQEFAEYLNSKQSAVWRNEISVKNDGDRETGREKVG